MAAHSKHSTMTREEFSRRSDATYRANSRYEGRPQSRGESSSARDFSRRNAAAFYASRRRHGRRMRTLKVFLTAILAVILSGGVAVAAYLYDINGKLGLGVDANLLSVLTETKDNEPFYMLLLGIDKDEERAGSSEYGSSNGAYRSDTIMLARIDPGNKKVTLISIPRDTYVDMGKNGHQKINAAYAIGGAAYATQVVSEFAGVPISHYAEVDMDGFAAIVNQLGGVTVDLPVPVRDPDYTGLDLPAGEQTLDGETAALLGRSRHAYDSYGGGDFYRAANQRMLIGAVIEKLMQSNPLTMANTVSTLAGYVTCDMGVSDIVGLASKFTGIDISSDIYSGQCPTTSQYKNDTWYEVCDAVAWREIMQRVDAGEAPYTDESQDATSGVAGSVGQSVGAANSSGGAVGPEFSGSVSVLNGSGISGAAKEAATKLQGAGFSTSADNTRSHTETMVIYNGDGAGKAAGVAQTLGLGVTPVANDGSWPSSTDVVVVLGSN